jgi:hypothetical protein
VDVRVHAADVFPIRKIQSVGFKRRAQFQQHIGRAHFFECNHVGIHRRDAFTNFGFGFGGLDEMERFGWLIQIIFDVLSGDAEGFSGDKN